MATQHPSYATATAQTAITQEECNTRLFKLEASRGIGNPPIVNQSKNDGMYVKVDAPATGNHKTVTAQVAGLCTLAYPTAAKCKEMKSQYGIKVNYSTLPTELVFVLEHINQG